MPVRVLLSYQHKVMAEAMASVLKSHHDLQLVGVAYDDAHALRLCDECSPDVVVLGMQQHTSRDIEATRQLAHASGCRHVVVFSSDTTRSSIMEVMDAGALGYVCTTSSMNDLMAAIRSAALGRAYLCQTAAQEMVQCVRRVRSGHCLRPSSLGDREEQVLRLIAVGYSSKEIARDLCIAPSTVDVHRRNIMRKVGLHKVADLTRYAIRNQMVAV